MNYIESWPGLLRYTYQIKAKTNKRNKTKSTYIGLDWNGIQEELK
jgi:hypothetical protein